MQLETWISATYLDAETVASYASKFAGSPHASVVLDDFLVDDKLTALQRFFSVEGRFEEHHTAWKKTGPRTYGSEETVSPEAWSVLPEKRRAASELRLVGPKPEYRLGQGTITHLRFVDFARSPAFMGFLAAMTGIRPVTLTGMQTRIMILGDYLRPHSDEGSGRTLCAIFYVSDGWRPSFGGRFRHLRPETETVPVDPIANRFLVFAPQDPHSHDVEALTPAAGGWQRSSYTLWFGSPD